MTTNTIIVLIRTSLSHKHTRMHMKGCVQFFLFINNIFVCLFIIIISLDISIISCLEM